ncbi:apolipoprotein N-acyltransferase [Synechococcus sp. RSCCF101]|uniref:apolipoprotein N-acyltransferase n=1 Tax=Synechococcus sp. RSCCF101 TaxID=2511069 RepID=UPI0012452069|nr:apolipoprotein N-acyltransferase [Synechococcus sp. RSCCF101]QEY31931.1 apolipoprotein N-acyltransferase [Synechococcus sp. RSCCF101]
MPIRAAIAGLLAGLALPPQGWPWLLWPCLAVLWRLCAAAPRPALAGALWGGTAVLVSHRWLLALHPLDWLGIPLPISLPLVVMLWLFCAALAALLVGAWAALAGRLTPITADRALLLACLWGLAEVVLARLPLFWLGLGSVVLPGDPALAGLASGIGAGGLATVQLMLGWGLHRCWPVRSGRPRLEPWTTAARRGLSLAAVVLALHGLGAWALVGATPPPAQTFRPEPDQASVALLAYQPAVPTREKFDPGQIRRMRRGLEAAQAAARAMGLAGVVAPEGMLSAGALRPEPWDGELLSGGFRRTATGLRSSLLRFEDGRARPGSALDKHRLVLLGEWVPLARWWSWTGLSAVGGVEPGAPSRLMRRPGADLGLAICYEISDGESLAAAVRRGAGWLLAIANLDPYPVMLQQQFLALARLRAIETRRPVLLAANTGPTASLGPDGAIEALLTGGRPGLLPVELQPRNDRTLYARWGSWPLLALLVASGLRVASRSISPPPSSRSPS